MRVVGVKAQSPHPVLTELVAGQHTVHGLFQESFGFVLPDLEGGLGLQAARVARVPGVLMLDPLATREFDVLAIGDDDDVAVQSGGVVRGLVFTLEEGRDLGRHTTEALTLGLRGEGGHRREGVGKGGGG